jgi:aspartyl-tRNA(Asn)/glutamyl-tRNA(Gln) amidotransferase subunit A
LQDLGAVVEQVDPGIEDPLDITTGLWFAGAYQVWQSLSPAQQAVTDPDFKAQAELGSKLDVNAIHALNQRRGVLGSHLRQFMQRFDLILTPSTAVTAFKARPAGHSPMDAQAMLGWTPFSYPFNLSQQPAISLPCGLTLDGLPMGVQLVGPMFGDALVLQAAQALQACYPMQRPVLSKRTLRPWLLGRMRSSWVNKETYDTTPSYRRPGWHLARRVLQRKSPQSCFGSRRQFGL